MTLTDTVAAIRSKKRSAVEVTRQSLDAIEKHNAHLGAFISIDGERALQRARDIDARLARGAEVKRRIMLGTFALSSGYYDAYYVKALKVRTLITRDFEAAFEKVDVIASPVSPFTAFKLGEKIDDPLAMYLADIYTISANLAGIAGISIPCGFDTGGLPIGLQLMAPHFAEDRLLAVSHQFQRLTNHHHHHSF